jgi:hypothetical protein
MTTPSVPYIIETRTTVYTDPKRGGGGKEVLVERQEIYSVAQWPTGGRDVSISVLEPVVNVVLVAPQE